MRIIIDTELQTIIVPDSYYSQVDNLNEIIEEAGGQPLDYVKYIRTCFEKAYATKIISQHELTEMRGRKKKAKAEE